MPCLVSNYEQGKKWKTDEVGKLLNKILESKGVKFISWVWQAGGVASRKTSIRTPDDLKGVKIRGGSSEMDRMLGASGAIVSTMPSNEMYIGMQTGSLDAAVSSSTSLISFRLEELSKSLTTGRTGSFWFMLEPLLMSKEIFDSLPADQQKAILEVGIEMEDWATKEAKKDDEEAAKVYAAKGAQIVDLTPEDLAKWRAISETSAWKDFAAKTTAAGELLKLAKGVS
jgi:TRAP-type C4-dicarboxylate transport system substrate-binding protein